MTNPKDNTHQILQLLKGVSADISEIKTNISTLSGSVSQLKSDVSQLKSDVSQLKSDVSQLKSDVSQLKTDVLELKLQVGEHNTRLSRLEELGAENRSTIQKVLEAVSDHGRQLSQIRRSMAETQTVSPGIVQKALRATNLQVHNHEKRLTQLEATA
jgi:chromosome segregation ATPase